MKEQIDEIKATNFGVDQINNEPPKFIKRLRSAATMGLAGSLPFAATIAPKFGTDVETYGSWVGIGILAVRSISMLFGVEDEAKG